MQQCMCVHLLIIKELVWRWPERAETSSKLLYQTRCTNWTWDCISCVYLVGTESSYIMLIYFTLQELTIIPKSSWESQYSSQDTTAWACVWLEVPALQFPNAIHDLQQPSAPDVHSEQTGPLLTGKNRNIVLQGLQPMSTNTHSTHIDFRRIWCWPHSQSQVNDAQGVLRHIPVLKNIQSFLKTVATNIHTTTIQELCITTTDQPKIQAESYRYKKRQTIERPIHNTRQLGISDPAVSLSLSPLSNP
jgi:hypothetical protein